MARKCSNCGFKAGDKSFFRKEKGGIWGAEQTVCEGCVAYQPNLDEYRAFYYVLFNAAIWSFLVCLHFRNTPSISWWVAIIFVTNVLTTRYQTFIHEAGHALTAYLCGYDIWRVNIGSGPLRRRVSLFGINFDVRRYGHTGGETAYFSLDGPKSRLRRMLIIAAGPLANLIAAAASFALAYGFSYLEEPGLVGTAIFSGFGLANVTMALRNLLRRKSGTIASDGKQLADLMRHSDVDYWSDPELRNNMIFLHVCALGKQGRHREAVDIAMAHIWTSPHKLGLACAIMDSLSYAKGDQAVVDFYLSHRSELTKAQPQDLSGPAYVCANAAWSALKLYDPSLLDLAASCSQDAYEAIPESAEIAATRGAYLIASGKSGEGLPLIISALPKIEVLADKADLCIFAAQGYRQIGQTDRANVFAALGGYLKIAA